MKNLACMQFDLWRKRRDEDGVELLITSEDTLILNSLKLQIPKIDS